jgi:hypothetical protein
MTLKQAHSKLGHIPFPRAKQIASKIGWTINVNVEIYKACAEA